MDKYYKVVRTDLTSAIFIADSMGLQVQYIRNEWVKSKLKQAPLMVFKSLDAARAFIHNNTGAGPHRIFECEIKKSKRKWGWLFNEMKEPFFLALKRKKKWTHLIDYGAFPEGTVFADEVMLVREVVNDRV